MKLLASGLGGAALLMFGACADVSSNSLDDLGYKGTGIAVGIAPLTLESLGDACYSFAVVNQADQLVVGRGPSVNAMTGVSGLPISANDSNAICASRFGNTTGGDISYVAPCDADSPDHDVHVWVEALCAEGQTGESCSEIQDYVNPCPGTAGCSLQVTCEENADTPVTFNFTIMGQADQGFFDIAVNFDDIFCSAKLDSCYNEEDVASDGADPDMIELLFDNRPTIPGEAPFVCPYLNGCKADGSEFDPLNDDPSLKVYGQGQAVQPMVANPNYQQRMNTVVLALGCTAGPIADGADSVTQLYAGNVVVRCSEGAWALDVSTATLTQEGNQTGAAAQGAPFPWSAYFGTEALPNVDKKFLNLALGLEGLTNCTVSWQASAFDANNPPSFGDPSVYNSYPAVAFVTKPPITDDSGVTLCQENPVNGVGSTVHTNYVRNLTPVRGANGVTVEVHVGRTRGLTNQIIETSWTEGTATLAVAVLGADASVASLGFVNAEEETGDTLSVDFLAKAFSKEQFIRLDALRGVYPTITDAAIADIYAQTAAAVIEDASVSTAFANHIDGVKMLQLRPYVAAPGATP